MNSARREPEATPAWQPCPRCFAFYEQGRIPGEMVMPVLPGAMAPLARDGSGKCCQDCASADGMVPRLVPEFSMARIVVGNERREQLRMPGLMMGMVKAGWVRPSKPGDFERHIEWLAEHNILHGERVVSRFTWEQVELHFPGITVAWDIHVEKRDVDQSSDVLIDWRDGPAPIVVTVLDEDGQVVSRHRYRNVTKYLSDDDLQTTIFETGTIAKAIVERVEWYWSADDN